MASPKSPQGAARVAAQFVRFGVVGLVCFLGGLFSVYLLTDVLRLHYLLSMAISLVLLNLVGWLLNRRWTFELHVQRSWAELLRYLAVTGAGFVATLALLALLVSRLGMNYLVASAVVAALMMVINFAAHRLWSLRPRAPST